MEKILNIILRVVNFILGFFDKKPKVIEHIEVLDKPIANQLESTDPEEPLPYFSFKEILFSDIKDKDPFVKDALQRVVSLKNNGFVDAAFHSDIMTSFIPYLNSEEIYKLAKDYIMAGIAPHGVVLALFDAYRMHSNKGVNKSMEKAKKIVESLGA